MLNASSVQYKPTRWVANPHWDHTIFSLWKCTCDHIFIFRCSKPLTSQQAWHMTTNFMLFGWLTYLPMSKSDGTLAQCALHLRPCKPFWHCSWYVTMVIFNAIVLHYHFPWCNILLIHKPRLGKHASTTPWCCKPSPKNSQYIGITKFNVLIMRYILCRGSIKTWFYLNGCTHVIHLKKQSLQKFISKCCHWYHLALVLLLASTCFHLDG